MEIYQLSMAGSLETVGIHYGLTFSLLLILQRHRVRGVIIKPSWKHGNLSGAHSEFWKSRWRSKVKTGGTLCYTPERVYILVIATMVLHNLCIYHSLQWNLRMVKEDSSTADIYPTDATTFSGSIVRKSVIANYFD